MDLPIFSGLRFSRKLTNLRRPVTGALQNAICAEETKMAQQKLINLVETKMQLADKYDRLSKLACSDPKRTKFRRKAAEFRHQAKMLRIKAEQS